MNLFTLFIILISNSSQAAKCPGEDVRLDHKGGSMELVKPRNQGQQKDCYAFAAAEVWDAFRFSHYDKKTLEKEKGFYTIPMQGALAVNLENNAINKFDLKSTGTQLFEKGGDPSSALMYYMSHPTCVSDDTSDAMFLDLPGKTAEEKRIYLQTIVDNGEEARQLLLSYQVLSYQARAKGKTKQYTDALQLDYDSKYKESVSSTTLKLKNACTNGVLDANFEKFISSYMNSARFSENSLQNILNSLLASCAKRSAPVNVKAPTLQMGLGCKLSTNTIMLDTRAQASTAIHGALSGNFNKPTQPVILSVCSNFLEDGSESEGIRRNKDGTIDRNAMKPGAAQYFYNRCKPHALVAIGRKTEGDQCKILLRNSWKRCKNYGYSKDWKCDEQGDDVWVDEGTLINNTLNYSFFKD